MGINFCSVSTLKNVHSASKVAVAKAGPGRKLLPCTPDPAGEQSLCQRMQPQHTGRQSGEAFRKSVGFYGLNNLVFLVFWDFFFFEVDGAPKIP